MRVLFAGTPEAAVPALMALHASTHRIVAVLTRPDARTGRRGTPTPAPVAAAAEALGLPVIKTRTLRGDEIAASLADLHVDAAAVVAYGALIPPALLTLPTAGWINLHFSLLPAWRGAAPVQAAIRAGDEITGATTFRIEAGLDTGPVFGSVTEPIGATDTAGQLLDRLAASGAELLIATLDAIAAGTAHPIPQPGDGVSHAPKITADDARIDITAPALAVDRQIRAVTPHPGAWIDSRFGRLGLGPVTVSDLDTGALPPGELSIGKREVLLGTATVPVRLGTITAPGKRAMPAADWARGARPHPRERLGAAPGAGLDAAPDVAPHTAPDVGLDAAPDVAPHTAPDVGLGTDR